MWLTRRHAHPGRDPIDTISKLLSAFADLGAQMPVYLIATAALGPLTFIVNGIVGYRSTRTEETGARDRTRFLTGDQAREHLAYRADRQKVEVYNRTIASITATAAISHESFQADAVLSRKNTDILDDRGTRLTARIDANVHLVHQAVAQAGGTVRGAFGRQPEPGLARRTGSAVAAAARRLTAPRRASGR